MRARLWTIGLISLVLLSLPPGPVHAAAALPSYALNVHDGKVSVLISLNFQQNLTALASSFSLPQFRGSLVGSNSTAALHAVQDAISSKDSQADVTDLVLTATSSPVNSATNSQWLNMTLSFDITGVVSNVPLGGERIDLSWKSFTVLQDLAVGGTEVNNIGAKYMAAYALQIASSQVSSRFITFTLKVDGKLTGTSGFSEAMASFKTMNFSRLSRPVSAWQEAYDSSSNQVTWSYEPARNLGLSVTGVAQEPPDQGGGSATFRYGLFYSLAAQVRGPNRSTVNVDTIIAIFNDSSEALMSTIIALIAIPGIGAFVYEHHLSAKTPRKKSRK
jgi:hypothetical protein